MIYKIKNRVEMLKKWDFSKMHREWWELKVQLSNQLNLIYSSLPWKISTKLVEFFQIIKMFHLIKIIFRLKRYGFKKFVQMVIFNKKARIYFTKTIYILKHHGFKGFYRNLLDFLNSENL